jgi:hypothetical protein
MNRIFMALAALLALSSFGCVARTITHFEDNQKSPVTALEVDKVFTIPILSFYSKTTHQFYLCQDTGNQLVCKLSCDGTNDAVCPMGTTTNRGVTTTTNVR